MEVLNVGIIGAGGIAQKLHLPEIARTPGLRVTCLAGRKEPRRAAQSRSHASETQQLLYRRSPEGLSVEGWLMVPFARDQRTANAHVAFCPAFQRSPVIQAEASSGASCAVRPSLIVPGGVRWEVKLDTPAAAETHVRLDFIATECKGS